MPAYRRTLRYVPEPLGNPSNPMNRQDRKRHIPLPLPNDHHPQGIKQFPYDVTRPKDVEANQPSMYRHARPDPASTCLRETIQVSCRCPIAADKC